MKLNYTNHSIYRPVVGCCCFERAWTPRKLISAWGPSSYGSIASLGLETPEMEAAGAGAAGIPVFL